MFSFCLLARASPIFLGIAGFSSATTQFINKLELEDWQYKGKEGTSDPEAEVAVGVNDDALGEGIPDGTKEGDQTSSETVTD